MRLTESVKLDSLLLYLSILISGLVITWLIMAIVGSFQRLTHQKDQQELALQLMQDQISFAKRRHDADVLAWNGYRKFEVIQRSEESTDTTSFYLAPHDNKPLPAFKPGQYLTFSVNVPGREKPVVRCYSISQATDPDHYRVTIKRVLSPLDNPAVPPGLVSNYFHEQVQVGDILDVQAPRGHFVLDPERQRPAVMIAGGVGITPLIPMLQSVAASRSGQEVMLFYGVRNRQCHAFKDQLEAMASDHANIRLVVCYSQPSKEDEHGEGRDYHHDGRINIDLLRSYLPASNYDFYLCGPPDMMETLTTQLTKWGANKNNLFLEAFGSATVTKARAKPTTKTPKTCRVTFAKSDKVVECPIGSRNLLDLAESNGVKIESGCRAGNCGTCTVAIKSGEVEYLAQHGAEIHGGSCLTCIAAPKGDIILDA